MAGGRCTSVSLEGSPPTMIEEPVSDVEIKSEGTSDGPDEDAELVIVTNELEEHCYSKVKLKLFEQRYVVNSHLVFIPRTGLLL